MDLAVEVPARRARPVASNEMWGEIYDRIAELIREHRTTLVFVNTRRLAERVAHHLAERLGENAVLPHHGSLSRKLRLEAEERLKSGELRAVVATASLELGIDIGTVDLVCQIGSPRSIAVALQRVGRAGHWVGALPKGRLFATTRDELIECAALVRAIRRGELDRLEIPRNALDMLAQQIVAACACEDWRRRSVRAVRQRLAVPHARRARDFEPSSKCSPKASPPRAAAAARTCIATASMARARPARRAPGRDHLRRRDPRDRAVPGRRRARRHDRRHARRGLRGREPGRRRLLLGTTSWRIRRVESGRVRVEDAHGAAPTIPFWRGEARAAPWSCRAECPRCARTHRLAARAVRHARRGMRPRSPAAPRRPSPTSAPAAAALGVCRPRTPSSPSASSTKRGGMQLVLHAPFGARINRAWGLALRKRFCRSFNFELQAAATDNGIVISLGEQHSFPLEIVFEFLHSATVEDVLTQAMLPAPMFAARWRWNASRALAMLRFRGGRKVPPPIQRMRADDLLAAVFPDQAACQENLAGEIRIPDHPLVKETIDNCLHEAMDLDGLKRVLGDIDDGAIRTVAIDTPEPSPFSHEILNANPVRLSRRRAARRAPRARRADAPHACRRTAPMAPARWIPQAIAQVAAKRGRRCAMPTNCTMRCSRSI